MSANLCVCLSVFLCLCLRAKCAVSFICFISLNFSTSAAADVSRFAHSQPNKSVGHARITTAGRVPPSQHPVNPSPNFPSASPRISVIRNQFGSPSTSLCYTMAPDPGLRGLEQPQVIGKRDVQRRTIIILANSSILRRRLADGG